MFGAINNYNCTLIFVLFLFHAQQNVVRSAWVSTPLIKSACPSLVSNGPAPSSAISARHHAIATGYSMITLSNRPSSVAPLFGKKNKGVTKGGKIQVKLLKYIEGTGSIGDVILVSPAFFENKLKREKSAIIVSDQEVTKEKQETDTKAKEKLRLATDLQGKLNDFLLVIPHKAGPEGHLYGGIGKKLILDEIKKKFPKGVLSGKQNKILSMAQKQEGDEKEKELDHDIKELGEYSISICLHSDVSAKFIVSVVSE